MFPHSISLALSISPSIFAARMLPKQIDAFNRDSALNSKEMRYYIRGQVPECEGEGWAQTIVCVVLITNRDVKTLQGMIDET